MLHRIAIAVVALCLTPPARAGLEIWDTGKTSAEPLALAAIESKAGWTKIAETGEVKGDAVLSNGRISLVVQKSGRTELYSPTASRARVVLEGGGFGSIWHFDKITVVENGKGAVAVEVAGPARSGGVRATLRLKKG